MGMEHDGMMHEHISTLADHDARLSNLEVWKDRVETDILGELSKSVKELSVAVAELRAVADYKRWLIPFLVGTVVSLAGVMVSLWTFFR